MNSDHFEGFNIEEVERWMKGGFKTIRCATFEHYPEHCSEDKTVSVPNVGDKTWMDVVTNAGWLLVVVGDDAHRHVFPFCSILCVVWFAKRQEIITDQELMSAVRAPGVKIEGEPGTETMAQFLIGFDFERMEVDIQLQSTKVSMPWPVYSAFVRALVHSGSQIDAALRRHRGEGRG